MSAKTLADVIRANNAVCPDSLAIVGEGRSVTYGELSSRSDSIAAGLVAAGLSAGDRVAYLARNATEYWELFFAAAKAGVVIVPLNFRLSGPEIAWILDDADPSAILVEDHLTNLVPNDWKGLRLVFSQSAAPSVVEELLGTSDVTPSLVEELRGTSSVSKPQADDGFEASAADGLRTSTSGDAPSVVEEERGTSDVSKPHDGFEASAADGLRTSTSGDATSLVEEERGTSDVSKPHDGFEASAADSLRTSTSGDATSLVEEERGTSSVSKPHDGFEASAAGGLRTSTSGDATSLVEEERGTSDVSKPRWLPFESWLASHPATDPHRDLGGDALCSLMYSSGTTGRPKGVTTTVAGMLFAVEAFGALFNPSPSSVSLVPTPYYHIAAGGWSLITLATGGRIVQFTEVTPQNMLALLVGHKATHVIMVPTVMQLFITSPEASAADYSSVEHVVYGGSPISETVMLGAQKVFGAELSQSYGLTETIGVTTFLRPEDHVVSENSKLRSAGRAVPGVEVAIMDPDTGELCETGVVGEVVTRGPGVTKAYWRNPSATADAFWPGEWFRTGDAGYMDADGYVFLKDRIKDLLMSGGENIYPAEVENAIMAHPAVQEVAVIGVPSEKWGETPLAVVVPKAGSTIDRAELIAFTRERLAHYKCPTAVEVVEQLPRNPSGKVLKRELRAPWWAGHDRSIG